MSQAFRERQLLLAERTVTDPKEIERYDKEFNGNYFVHQNDINALDPKFIQSAYYVKSKKMVGEISSIYIAVNDTDPFKSSTVSPYRTHGRVGDGLNRHLQAKNKKTTWSHKYIMVKSFEEFIFLWSQFGSEKSAETIQNQKRTRVLEYCNYAYDHLGITPKSKVSAFVVKKLGNNHPYNTRTLLRLISEEFKDPSKQRESEETDSKKEKKKSKKDIIIEKLTNELDSSQREINKLKINAKSEDQKDMMIYDLESKYQKMVKEKLRLQDEVKRLKKELGKMKNGS